MVGSGVVLIFPPLQSVYTVSITHKFIYVKALGEFDYSLFYFFGPVLSQNIIGVLGKKAVKDSSFILRSNTTAFLA